MKKLAFVLLLAICLGCKQELVIIHTNDTHAHYEPLRTGENLGDGGVIERAAFIDSVRAAVGENNVLLLHAGDFSQGTSYFTLLEGQFEPKILNALRYDCVTLGNHEFDNGLESLTERLAQLNSTKVVASNIDLSNLPIAEFVTPYAVFERAGRKIGILGLQPNLAANVSAAVSSQITQLDDAESVNRWAAYLRDEQGCDVVIALSHLGFYADIDLVAKISGVDIFVGGHSHTDIDKIAYARDAKGRRVAIVTDGSWGLTMGELKLR